MGYDVSYHPISADEMYKWYFDRMDEVRDGDYKGIRQMAGDCGVDEFYVNKYIDTMKVAVRTVDTDTFEKTHAYYMAVIQGFFRTYYYTRGTALSFLIEENPGVKEYVTEWQTVSPANILNRSLGGIRENYSGGVYLSPEQTKKLLNDYNSGTIQTVLNDFFQQNISVFLRALRDAAENDLGVLEATEVVEPQPIDLSQTTSFSDLKNCDQEGAFLYQQTALEQIKAFTGSAGAEASEIVEKVTYEKQMITKEKPAKTGFFRNLFRK